jgi:hypothetical protein
LFCTSSVDNCFALHPDTPAASDVAVDAAVPSPTAQPYLTARLDITAVLPLSSSFFQQKSLAVAAGLSSTAADDLVTDGALAEQGLLSQRQLAAKWGQQGLELLGLAGGERENPEGGPDVFRPEGQAGHGPDRPGGAVVVLEGEAGDDVVRSDSSSALAGAAAAAAVGEDDAGSGVGLGGGYADDAAMGAAVAGGLMEAGDDETVAGGWLGWSCWVCAGLSLLTVILLLS